MDGIQSFLADDFADTGLVAAGSAALFGRTFAYWTLLFLALCFFGHD